MHYELLIGGMILSQIMSLAECISPCQADQGSEGYCHQAFSEGWACSTVLFPEVTRHRRRGNNDNHHCSSDATWGWLQLGAGRSLNVHSSKFGRLDSTKQSRTDSCCTSSASQGCSSTRHFWMAAQTLLGQHYYNDPILQFQRLK